jgi:hypothetical protein
MKNKILVALTAFFVLGLAMAVYAFNQTNTSVSASASCCKKSDACPLKNKNAQTAENHTKSACCDNENCCCKTGACPMKATGENASSESCCGNCCGGSCPMKNKGEENAEAVKISNETAVSGESCQHKKAGI